MADIEQRALQKRLRDAATAYALLGEKDLPNLLSEAAAALRAAPEGFTLVDLDDHSVLPDTPTERMLDVAWPDHEFIDATFDKQGAYADLLAPARVLTTLATIQPPADLRSQLGEVS